MSFIEETITKRYPDPKGEYSWYWCKRKGSDKFEIVKVIGKTDNWNAYLEGDRHSRNIKEYDCIWGDEVIFEQSSSTVAQCSFSTSSDGLFATETKIKLYPNPNGIGGWYWLKKDRESVFKPVLVNPSTASWSAYIDHETPVKEVKGVWGDYISLDSKWLETN